MNTGQPTLCLRTGDLQQAERFYEALGFTRQTELGVPGQSSVIARGNFQIMLMSNFGEDSINFRGADAVEVAEHMTAAGFTMPGEPERGADGESQWFTRDPDGHALFFNTQPRELTSSHKQSLIARTLTGALHDLQTLGASDGCLRDLQAVIDTHGDT